MWGTGLTTNRWSVSRRPVAARCPVWNESSYFVDQGGIDLPIPGFQVGFRSLDCDVDGVFARLGKPRESRGSTRTFC